MKAEKVNVHHGMNRKDALDAARALGCTVEGVHGAGEMRIICPKTGTKVVINNRRKDVARTLTSMLMKLMEAA